MSREAVDAQLLGPGGPFEITTQLVLGVRMPVFARRARSLRAVVESSLRFANAEYIAFAERRWTFAEHARAVSSVARALAERFGVEPGDRVALLAGNCPEWIIAFWATVSLGAVAVGLNGWWTGDEILYGIGDCRPKVLIADRKRLDRLAGTGPGVPVLEIESAFGELLEHAPTARLPEVAIAEDDPAIMLYTSGTTGRPKGAVQSHRSVVAFIGLALYGGARGLILSSPPRDAAVPPHCFFVTNPLFHVSGLHSAAIMSLATGVRSVWHVGRFDPVEAMRTIERERCTSWAAMNTMVWRIIDHPDFARYDLSSLRQLGGGGAPTSPELQRRMRDAFPALGRAGGRLDHGYGSTETGAVTSIGGDEWAQFSGSVGRALPTVEVEIRDDAGRPQGEGQEGEIYVRSPLVMLEYWNRPEASAEALLPGRWYRTGDIGRLRNGRLYLASRRDDLILRGSENIYSVEIENRLAAHPDVAEAAVYGVPHRELGQEVLAVVVPRDGATLDVTGLERFVAEALAYFKVPAHWQIRRDPLPRNALGKVLKHVLRGLAESRYIDE